MFDPLPVYGRLVFYTSFSRVENGESFSPTMFGRLRPFPPLRRTQNCLSSERVERSRIFGGSIHAFAGTL